MDHPIKLQLDKKKGDSYVMRVSVPKGYAIQKDAPNKIKLASEDKIKINPNPNPQQQTTTTTTPHLNVNI